MNFDTGVISTSSPSIGAWARAAGTSATRAPSAAAASAKPNRVMDSSSGSVGLFATSGRSVIRTPIPRSMSIRITSGSFTVQAPSTTPAFRASATASGVTSE